MDNIINEKYKSFTERFYQEGLNQINDTYKDVQWGSEYSQNLRFKYLLKLFNEDKCEDISILDVGCGLGHFYKYVLENINNNSKNIHYVGLDINTKFIKYLKDRYPTNRFIEGSLYDLERTEKFDYVIASGIFNIGNKDIDMDDYLKSSIEKMFSLANKGIAFNLLTHFTPKDNIGAIETYYDPLEVLNYCFQLTKKINFYHSYRVNDFTIIMYK